MQTPRRGLEFKIGAVLVAVSIAIIFAAYFLEGLRHIVSSMGAATASLAVVGAALIAYDGAMAKVRYDSDKDEKLHKAKKKNLITKLLFGLDVLRQDIGGIKHAKKSYNLDTIRSEAVLKIPDILTDVFDSLDQLPDGVVENLGGMLLTINNYNRNAIIYPSNQNTESTAYMSLIAIESYIDATFEATTELS